MHAVQLVTDCEHVRHGLVQAVHTPETGAKLLGQFVRHWLPKRLSVLQEVQFDWITKQVAQSPVQG
mgnify:FL=1